MAEKWRLLDLSYPSAFQNLALEEALARSMIREPLPTVRIWVNPKAVVVGRFQEVEAEVDRVLCEQNHVQIARRFTGGGAVYHDNGSLNLTIVTPRQNGISLNEIHQTNYKVVWNLLNKFGIESRQALPNALEISGKKISGAAAALSRDFAFWHASILVSTNTNTLNQVLLPSRTSNPRKFTHSKWQEVITLESALGTHVEIKDVKRRLVCSFENSFGVRLEISQLTADEEEQMGSLYASKYSTREWNQLGSLSTGSFERNRRSQTTIAV